MKVLHYAPFKANPKIAQTGISRPFGTPYWNPFERQKSLRIRWSKLPAKRVRGTAFATAIPHF
jgi:hypothetical protein